MFLLFVVVVIFFIGVVSVSMCSHSGQIGNGIFDYLLKCIVCIPSNRYMLNIDMYDFRVEIERQKLMYNFDILHRTRIKTIWYRHRLYILTLILSFLLKSVHIFSPTLKQTNKQNNIKFRCGWWLQQIDFSKTHREKYSKANVLLGGQ